MPRDLMQSDRNELKIKDSISGDEIVLFYRLPATKDRIAFQKACWKREGNKLFSRIHDARAKYGAEILTGIREGDFVFGGKPVASDEGSPNYREDWKKLVEETAGDLLMMLGQQVFEGLHQQVPADLQVVDGIEEEGEETGPLDQS